MPELIRLIFGVLTLISVAVILFYIIRMSRSIKETGELRREESRLLHQRLDSIMKRVERLEKDVIH